MRVLILSIDLRIPGCRGLKERRGILEPLKNRLRRDLNLSVSEMEPRNSPDRGRIGIASVIEHRAAGDSQLEKIRDILVREHRVSVLEETLEYW